MNTGLRVKSEEYKLRRFGGITLISLIITIVILIILAGVAINLSIGENGIFNKAKFAKEEYINSIEDEQKQINDAYGQMLVATEENATITMTMKQLNDLVDERINNKLDKIYIDTSNKIADITINVEYEATQDCIIVGRLSTAKYENLVIKIDGIDVGSFTNNNSLGIAIPIYYNLKSGQKIEFTSSGSNTRIVASAYSTL